MNEWLGQLGLHAWKPLLTACLLPPVPMLVMAAWAGWRLRRQRRGGGLLLGLALSLIWLSCTLEGDAALQRGLLPSPAALSTDRLSALQREAAPAGRPTVAIVVLGGGRERLAPEYGVSNLGPESMERLRYGLWLARRTGAPVGFSGGTGWGASHGDPEGLVAARIAAQEFALPLRWVESESRDTRENAERIMPMLTESGVEHVLLVTHGWHMRRAVRAFEAAAGGAVTIEAAPMGLSEDDTEGLLRWMPTNNGYRRVRNTLRECLGLLFGA